MSSEWISIQERLPEKNIYNNYNEVLVYSLSEGVNLGSFSSPDTPAHWYRLGYDEGLHDVTHWMPVPEPPE